MDVFAKSETGSSVDTITYKAILEPIRKVEANMVLCKVCPHMSLVMVILASSSRHVHFKMLSRHNIKLRGVILPLGILLNGILGKSFLFYPSIIPLLIVVTYSRSCGDQLLLENEEKS